MTHQNQDKERLPAGSRCLDRSRNMQSSRATVFPEEVGAATTCNDRACDALQIYSEPMHRHRSADTHVSCPALMLTMLTSVLKHSSKQSDCTCITKMLST